MTLGEICKGIDMLPASQKRTRCKSGSCRCAFLYAAGFSPSPNPLLNVGVIWPRPQNNGASAFKVVDAVIAATALEHDLPLVTRNVKDFAASGRSSQPCGYM